MSSHYLDGFFAGLRPDTRLTVSEWADNYRILPMKSAKEAGKWRTARTPYLKEVMDCLSPSSQVEKVVFMKGAQVGGPLALDTPIPTVGGWTTMGNIEVGDRLFDEKGQPCRVQGVSPVFRNRDCFVIRFDDGEKITCDGSHRWPVSDFTSDKPVQKTLTTLEMFDKGQCYGIDSCKSGEQGFKKERRRIVAINPTESVPVRCIEVSSPSHLYLCGKGWIPTHNTECGNNWLGYVVHHTPGPMMYVLPTLDMAKRTSKQRIAPMIEEMPILRERVKDPRSRDSGNTQMVKEFPNGVLIITGANSATGLRSMPARFLFLDEVDAYEDDVDGEGSPINLAIKRTATFSRNRKILMVSTPNIAGASKIEAAYDASDQRQYHVPCIQCGYLQPIEWQQIRFEENDPETACFECISCGHRMQEHDKPKLLANGLWVSINPEADGKARGYHLSSLYSPNGWYSWANAVEDFLAAKNDPILLKDWTNTVLGQTWQEAGETVDYELLYQRREHYPAEVPWHAEVLTCGVDVQDDRIEYEVVGWGAGEESWSVDYIRLYGDLSRPDIWNILADKLRKPYRRQDGVLMNLAQVCMDSGGHYTDEVYAFSRKQGADWLIPIKGASQAGKPIATFPKTRNKKGIYLTLVGTDTAKELIYQRYRILEPGAGYCHWPVKDCFDEDYFKQATAEEKVRKYKKGVAYFEWDAKKKRNEALDCRVYALTAVRILQQHRGLDLERLAEQRPEPEVQIDHDDVSAKSISPRPRRLSRSTYLNG